MVEGVRQSCRNNILRFRRVFLRKFVLCEKMSVFIYFSQRISQILILQFAIVFRQCFQSSFRRRSGEKKNFFPGLSEFFRKNSGHWVETLMQSGKLFSQFHQNCFLRALFKICFQKTFCVMFHQSSFLDIYWKENSIFGEKLLAFIMFVATLTKLFCLFPEERLSSFFLKKVKHFSHFWKFERKVSVLW